MASPVSRANSSTECSPWAMSSSSSSRRPFATAFRHSAKASYTDTLLADSAFHEVMECMLPERETPSTSNESQQRRRPHSGLLHEQMTDGVKRPERQAWSRVRSAPLGASGRHRCRPEGGLVHG